MIIYYERYVVIQAGTVNGEGESKRLDFLTEEEYLNILDTLPDNHILTILIQINLLPK
jgi:DNA-directed RNA polymerase subunit beta'